jgi:hypothetical protein
MTENNRLNLRDSDVDGRIILKWTSEKSSVKV